MEPPPEACSQQDCHGLYGPQGALGAATGYSPCPHGSGTRLSLALGRAPRTDVRDQAELNLVCKIPGDSLKVSGPRHFSRAGAVGEGQGAGCCQLINRDTRTQLLSLPALPSPGCWPGPQAGSPQGCQMAEPAPGTEFREYHPKEEKSYEGLS